MNKVDYIVVGSGLAGILFCHELIKADQSFVVIDDASQQSSVVAGGLYNPVILKRFTPVWKAQEQLQLAIVQYKLLEELLQIQLDYKIPVRRLFNSIEEQNNWFHACDKPSLELFLKPEILQNKNECIDAPFGFGEVLNTGRIDTKVLINEFRSYLLQKDQLIEESFTYDQLECSSGGHCGYKDLLCKNVIFAEGFGLKQNPFFKQLPLKGTKGELLTIHAPQLKLDFVLKSGVFLIPLGNDIYRLGATYEWTDKTNQPTPQGKEELVTKLQKFLKCDFEVLEQHAGMRPTVIDRRPLVGEHSEKKNLYVLNGLGTRGIMIAPYAAKQLFELIENNQSLDKELNISRFKN